MVRTALYEAANVLLSRITRFSKLKRWGMDVAKRRGSKWAKAALACKIGVILHRMWIEDDWYRRPLRARREQPCNSRTADERDALAAFHFSPHSPDNVLSFGVTGAIQI